MTDEGLVRNKRGLIGAELNWLLDCLHQPPPSPFSGTEMAPEGILCPFEGLYVQH